MTLAEFIRKTSDLTYLPKAIFPSELYMFAQEVVTCGIDHIVESGVGHGGSTSYLDRLFPDIRITSVDLGDVNVTRFSHPRVEFIKGDARFVLPEFVKNSQSKRIAVLIDGPKGFPAVVLTKQLLSYQRVRFVAVHDLQVEKRNMIKRFVETAYRNSHDPDFRSVADCLDHEVEAISKHPIGPGLSVYHA